MSEVTTCSVLLSSEALPFFLLLIDLSKACALAKFALSSNSQVGKIVTHHISAFHMKFNSSPD